MPKTNGFPKKLSRIGEVEPDVLKLEATHYVQVSHGFY